MTSLDDIGSQIESHLDGLFGAALRYTRDRAQAEDLVQDTVVRALRFREHFAPGTNFRAWIYTILTHTFIHLYRRKKREREALDGSKREEVIRQLRSAEALQAATAPEHSYMERLLSDDVLLALDGLPEEFRTVVVLCDIEGLSYKDIAEAVGCPVGTVMSRLYRGRRLLERKLLGLAIEHGIVRGEKAAGVAAAPSSEDVVDLARFRRRKSG